MSFREVCILSGKLFGKFSDSFFVPLFCFCSKNAVDILISKVEQQSHKMLFSVYYAYEEFRVNHGTLWESNSQLYNCSY